MGDRGYWLPAGVLCGVSLVVGAVLSSAGPLDPPGGAVTPSYKTLSEIEPRTPIGQATTPGDADSFFRIAASGSYYLTGNVFGTSGKSGIEITAVNVTIDLNGYRFEGASGSLDGIVIASTANAGLTITNGIIRFWGGDGIDTTGADYVRIENITSSDNVGTGLRLSGRGLVRGCNTSDNDENGMVVGGTFIVRDSVCDNNGQDGIEITGGSTVTDNFCRSNGRLVANSAGIHADGFGARVQGNSIAKGLNSYGIHASGSDDIIVGNFVLNGSGSSNSYLFNSTTAAGPVVSVKWQSGSAWTGITNNNHPWANFTY